MRILLLSDIHSNLEALEASLAAAPPHDAIVNLGDIVGYGASPNEVTAKVRAFGGSGGCSKIPSMRKTPSDDRGGCVWPRQKGYTPTRNLDRGDRGPLAHWREGQRGARGREAKRASDSQ